ncbi:hepatitis A virus cellular receptor 1 homolog [Hyperolius riggenbachi]|uniref:hepatitis A virus cellular receptor 1 homolog n=1 Tax=Hyperolius riggenbachi TaxID=752182 RepID=UPI0035A3BD24
MDACSFWLSVVFLLHAAAAPEEMIEGTAGDVLTLPCTYSVTEHGLTTMCWGQDGCSNLYCNKVIVKVDSSAVTEVTSDRYRLLGNITQGDVSLTITNVTKSDEGQFCCRVEVPGWFNDKMVNYIVSIKERDPVTLFPTRITPSPSTNVQNHFQNHTAVIIPIFILLTTAVIMLIACRCILKMKKPPISAGPMAELAASVTQTEENLYVTE